MFQPTIKNNTNNDNNQINKYKIRKHSWNHTKLKKLMGKYERILILYEDISSLIKEVLMSITLLAPSDIAI